MQYGSVALKLKQNNSNKNKTAVAMGSFLQRVLHNRKCQQPVGMSASSQVVRNVKILSILMS